MSAADLCRLPEIVAAEDAETAAMQAYAEADAAHRAAFPTWDMTRELYRAGKRTDAEYLSARSSNDALAAAFDAAAAALNRATAERAAAWRKALNGRRRA